MAQRLVMWAKSLPTRLNGSQFRAVRFVHCLGLQLPLSNVFKHVRSLIGIGDTDEKISLRLPRRSRWFDLREEDRIHWACPNIVHKIVQFMSYEDKINDELLKFMVHHRRRSKMG